MKKFFFIFLFFCSFSIGATPLFALTVSPVVIDFDLLPGSAQEREITIVNEGSARERIVPTLFQVAGTDTQGFPEIQAVPRDALISRMISFPSGVEYVLAPGERKKIVLRVFPPSDTPAGGYYGVVSWGSSPLLRTAPLSGQPGVNLAINIQGNVSEGAHIASFFSGEDATGRSRSILFQVDVQNTGGRHFVPTGTVEIRTLFNRKVATLPLQSRKDVRGSGETRILPGTTRTLFARWDGTWALGPYRAILTLDAEGAGKYKAETSFSVYSRAAVTATLFIVLSIACTLITIARRRKKK